MVDQEPNTPDHAILYGRLVAIQVMVLPLLRQRRRQPCRRLTMTGYVPFDQCTLRQRKIIN